MNPGQTPGRQEKTKVLILAGSDPVGDWMAEVINLEEDMAFLGLVRDLFQALESVQKLEPDVVLVDVSSGILEQDDLLNQLAAPVSGAAVIVVAMMDQVETVRQAMLHGADGFLLKPFGEEDLIDSVHQAQKLVLDRRERQRGRPELPAGAEPEPKPSREIVAVFSPKGGVGCTTVAVNLAISLRTSTQKQVILMDGDLRFGDVDIALNITTTTSLGTLLPTLDTLEDDLLAESLVPHSSGIRVLVAPQYVDTADEISPEQITKMLARLSSLGEGYVVVDAWSSLDNCTLSILEACEYLVLVTTPHVTALRDTHRFLEVLSLFEYNPAKIVLVLNHCYHHSTFKLKDVERALGRPIDQEIAHAPQQVTTSLNRGTPLVLEYKNSSAAKDIRRLALLLSDKGAAAKQAGAQVGQAQAVPTKQRRRGLFFRRQAAPHTG